MTDLEKMTGQENPYAGQGAVLLDIGGAVGALVVTMPAWSEGLEVELRPVDADDHHGPHGVGAHEHRYPHVGVVGRPTESGTVYSLVYPAVLQGEYRLAVLPHGAVAMTVGVRGAEVSYAHWPEGG